MTGLYYLQKLPDAIKTKIATEWGSVAVFYQTVFDLHAQDYKLATQKPAGYQPQQQAIQSSLCDIEDKLESFGVVDGTEITTEISSDHSEIIVSRHIQDLDNYLKQFGTDFGTVSKWMKDKYGI